MSVCVHSQIIGLDQTLCW